MNYRHKYHAGNFADVLKHAVLARIVCYLRKKEKAFRVIDTHAGSGLYLLTAKEAQKTGEWTDGVGRLLNGEIPDAARQLLEPYVDVIRGLNPSDTLERYPGSPKLVRALLRKQDRLSAIELHPEDCAKLRTIFDGDFQTRVIALDGWLALGAHVPPKEKRGLVLVDPPFEAEGEFDRIVDGLARAHRRWANGTYCVWYPIKAGNQSAAFHAKLRALGIARILCVELNVMGQAETTGLAGSGLVIINPPFTLHSELEVLLPALKNCLSRSPGGGFRLFWISDDH